MPAMGPSWGRPCWSAPWGWGGGAEEAEERGRLSEGASLDTTWAPPWAQAWSWCRQRRAQCEQGEC